MRSDRAPCHRQRVRPEPFTKEIYAHPDQHKGIVPVVGVDGWIRIVNEHPQFDGIEVRRHARGRDRADLSQGPQPADHRDRVPGRCRRNTDPGRTCRDACCATRP